MTTATELAQLLKIELPELDIKFVVNAPGVRMISPSKSHLGTVENGVFELGKGFGSFIGRRDNIGEKIKAATPILIALSALIHDDTLLSALLPLPVVTPETAAAKPAIPTHFAGDRITSDRYGMMNQGKGSAGLEWALDNGLI